jgi:hypothetical protein
MPSHKLLYIIPEKQKVRHRKWVVLVFLKTTCLGYIPAPNRDIFIIHINLDNKFNKIWNLSESHEDIAQFLIFPKFLGVEV